MAGTVPSFQTQFEQSPPQSEWHPVSPNHLLPISGSPVESLLRPPRTLKEETVRALELSRQRRLQRGERASSNRLTPQSSPPLNAVTRDTFITSRTSPVITREHSPSVPVSKPTPAQPRGQGYPRNPTNDWTRLVKLGARDLKIPPEQEVLLSRDDSWLTLTHDAQKQDSHVPANDLAFFSNASEAASASKGNNSAPAELSQQMTEPVSEQQDTSRSEVQTRNESPEIFVGASQWPASPSRNGLPVDTDEEDGGSPRQPIPSHGERFHDSLETWSSLGTEDRQKLADITGVIGRSNMSQNLHVTNQDSSSPPVEPYTLSTTSEPSGMRDFEPSNSTRSGSALDLLEAQQRERSMLTQTSSKHNSNVQVKETPYLSNSDRRSVFRHDPLKSAGLSQPHVIPGTFISLGTQQSVALSLQDHARDDEFPGSQESMRQNSSPPSSAVKTPLVSALRGGKRISSSQDGPGHSSKKVRLLIEEPSRKQTNGRNTNDSLPKSRLGDSTPIEPTGDNILNSVGFSKQSTEITIDSESSAKQTSEAHIEHVSPKPTNQEIAVPSSAPETTSTSPSLPLLQHAEPAATAPVTIAVSSPENLFYKFTQAYPHYGRLESQFQSICQTLLECDQQRFLHIALWDDIVLRQFEDYAEHLVSCSKTGATPISPYKEFYSRIIKTTLYTKGILNFDNVSAYLRDNSVSTTALTSKTVAGAQALANAVEVHETPVVKVIDPVQTLVRENIQSPVQNVVSKSINMEAPDRSVSNSPAFESSPIRIGDNSPMARRTIPDTSPKLAAKTTSPVIPPPKHSISPVKTRNSLGSSLPAARPSPAQPRTQTLAKPATNHQLRNSVKSKYQSPLLALVRSGSPSVTGPSQKSTKSLKVAARGQRHSLPSSFQASQKSDIFPNTDGKPLPSTPSATSKPPINANKSAVQYPSIVNDDSVWMHDDDTPFKRYTQTHSTPASEPRGARKTTNSGVPNTEHTTPRQGSEVIDVDAVPAWVHDKNSAFKRYTREAKRRSLPASFTGTV